MPGKCAFCGEPSPIGTVALCECCTATLIEINPSDPRYAWFVRAVRRTLFNSRVQTNTTISECAPFSNTTRS